MPVKPTGFHENKTREEASNLLFLKRGITQVRVLPAYSESGKWFRQIREIPLFVNGKFSPVVSPSTNGEPCPFEQEGRRLYNLKGEVNIELAKKFRPRSSFLFNVVVQEWPDDFDIDIEQCVKVLKCGVKVKEQILDLDQDHSGGWGDITNLTNGVDLRITRTGTGRTDTQYTVKGVPGRTNILKYLEEKGFSQELTPHNLDNFFPAPSYEELEKMLIKFKEELEIGSRQKEETIASFQDLKEAARDSLPEAPIESENLEAPELEIE